MLPRSAAALLFWMLALWAGWCTVASGITGEDADGVKRTFNKPGMVSVIIYSNPAVQDRTREAGKSLDRFQGIQDFRSYVVVDLRGTMADWAPGYTTRRMQRDLDIEAKRITPFYRKNGNEGDPRKDVSATADFKGELCKQLGWTKPLNVLRVIVYGKDGKEVERWEDLRDYDELRSAVKKALE